MNATALEHRAAGGDAVRIVRAALRASPYTLKASHLVVVVLRLNEGERGVMLRDTFARKLRENDLEASAVECMNRKVRPGEALVWCDVDLEGLAHAGFSVAKVGRR